MRFAFIEAKKAEFPVSILCRVLSVSRSGFHAWRNRSESQRTRENRRLGVEIKAIHEENWKVYGSPRIHNELKQKGQDVGRNRVARLMKEAGIVGIPAKKFVVTTDSDHAYAIAPNLLKRDFTTDAPNKVWVTDITQISTWEGPLYLAAIIDLFHHKVVGFSMASHMRTELTVRALEMAVVQNPPEKGLIHHSDRGSQYASDEYQELLQKHHIVCSMSRKGDCWDNAVSESFWGTLKQELIYRRPWPTRREAERATGEYIHLFYNPKRTHSTIGGVSPMMYEKSNCAKLKAA